MVRICVILGFVLTGSMLYLPPLAWLASFFDADGNPPAVAMNLAFLSALLFVAPFGIACVPVRPPRALLRKGQREGSGALRVTMRVPHEAA